METGPQTTAQTGKIPCSVGMLTFNSGKGLVRCLESLAGFMEIIVCDGNSSDDTVAIAERYGAKVIPQYDTDERATPCVKDKAAVRQKSMDAATHDWFFFMDSDDTLSPEAVEEIRSIVTDPEPQHLIWRMPTRIFIEGKEILHEATYPSFQTRLVHRSVAARFKGEVHDRLTWDSNRFPVGTMHSYYNFHWSEERYRGFWSYLRRYADWEVETLRIGSLPTFLYWGVYRRLRTIAGYLLWRLPVMYLRWGTRGTMPLHIELTIVRYHLRILRRSIVRFFLEQAAVTILVETLRGKDINRTLSNMALRDIEVYGKILDIGGGDGKSSHYRFLRMTKWFRVVTIDISPAAKPDMLLNLEEDSIPVPEIGYDHLCAFNVLEHLHVRERVMREARLVLKEGGTLVGSIPFLVNVHPDPADYVRLTRQGLQKLFEEAGFDAVDIRAIGRGPFLAGYYQIEFLIPRLMRIVFLPLIFLLDALISGLRPRTVFVEKFPLSYVFVAQKAYVRH